MEPNRKLRDGVTLALALLGVLLSPVVQAVTVLPAPDFAISTAQEQVGLRSGYYAFAQASTDIETQADQLNKIARDWTDYISHAGSVAASYPNNASINASAEFQALTKVGDLKGLTHVKLERGGVANTYVFMQFMDVLKVDKTGKLNLDWVVSGTADRQTHPIAPNSFAASQATGELFVWPYGVSPTPGIAFPFTYYSKTIVTPTGNTHVLSEMPTYPAGSRWWVVGQVRLESTARADGLVGVIPPNVLESAARFEHTARLFITPDPSTPDVTFSALSGYDYRTAAVPEASTWMLLLTGLAVLAVGVRRSRAAYPAAEGYSWKR
jgi:hypothetical protein